MKDEPEITKDIPRDDTIREIVTTALGEPATQVALVREQGNVNVAYDVATRNGNFIVRVRFDRDELGQFLREKRCAELIRAKHDWTPEVIALGRLGGHCYSVQQKVQGIVASQYQGDMGGIWEQVGAYAAFFHEIQTPGYLREVFSDPPSDASWCKSYFTYLGQAADAQLVARVLLKTDEFESALDALRPLEDLKFKPTLAHGNLFSKNIIVDPNHKAHIIDWGSCEGHISCALDLSELFVLDVPQPHIEAYLRGHGLPCDYAEQNSVLLERLRLVRNFMNAHWLCESRSPREIDLLRYVQNTRKSIQRLEELT
jgi:fructosamine-3-kinase